MSEALGLERSRVSSLLELLGQGFHVAASMTGDRADIYEALNNKTPVFLQKTMG